MHVQTNAEHVIILESRLLKALLQVSTAGGLLVPQPFYIMNLICAAKSRDFCWKVLVGRHRLSCILVPFTSLSLSLSFTVKLHMVLLQ